MAISSSSAPLIQVENLSKRFPVRSGFFDKLRHREVSLTAVDDVSFVVPRGSVLGLVGESGCGKTTLGRLVLGLVKPTSGSILFDGVDITKAKGNSFSNLRRRMQLIQQDPTASLNPRMKIGDAIGHGLKIHKIGTNEGIRNEVLKTMESVGLTPAESLYDSYPRDLSGGMKQRVCIARAIILRPDFIVADEPVAMLDVSIRAMILNILQKARRELGLTYIFITHDITTAYYLCDKIMVMYMGQVVELSNANTFFDRPLHPYALALLSSAKEADPDLRQKKQFVAKGEVPNPLSPPSGCRFHPRCQYATEICKREQPRLESVGSDHIVACHNYDQVQLMKATQN
jgi:peptide/nickel transport system ATP-binding protein